MSIDQLRAHSVSIGKPLGKLLDDAVREYCFRHRLPSVELKPGPRRQARQAIAERIIMTTLSSGASSWETIILKIHAAHPDFGQRAARLARETLQQGGKIEKFKDGKRTMWRSVATS